MPSRPVPLWYVLAVPKGIPAAVVEKLRSAYAAALKDPDLQKTLQGLGVEVFGAGPEKAAEVMNADILRWKGLVKAANIKLQ